MEGLLNSIYLFVAIVLGILNIFQFFRNKSQVQILENTLASLHNISESLRNALIEIASNPSSFTDKRDVITTVGTVSQLASGMTQAIEEQRFFPKGTDAKKHREMKQEQFKKEMSQMLRKNKKENKQNEGSI